MTLEQRQFEIEQEYTMQGIADALSHWEKEQAAGRMADTGVGRVLAAKLFTLVKGAVEQRLAQKTRGIGGKYNQLLREVGVEKVAVIGIRTALGMFGKIRTENSQAPPELAQAFISKAGTDAELEHMFSKLKIAAPAYMRRVAESLRDANTRSSNHRKRTFTASANNVGLESTDVLWTPAERDAIGKLILELMVNSGVIELEHVPKGGGQHWVVVKPSALIAEQINSLSSTLKAFTKFPPMLIKPREHTRETLFNGASYVHPEMANLSGTIRLRTRRADHRRYIRENISDLALRAANKAAQVPYKVDVGLVSLLRDLFAVPRTKAVVGIPSMTPIKAPEYPLPKDWDREDEELNEQHNMWKALARQAYNDERERKAHVIAFSQTIKYMREYSDDTLYFPTYFDWRGRLYFRSRINPQSSDCVKAALRFARKKRLGKRGLFWLKAHVATTYGFDKKLNVLRAAWTDEHIEQLRDAVANHIDSEFFKEADSPWCFYVAAKDLLEALDSGNPEEHMSDIPVARDATCSGMQHLSAALRDTVGGMFTNLLPNNGDEKEDIYAGVAAIAVSRIQKDKENAVQAQYWVHNGVPRSMAKRPVMTYVYGGTLQSCTEYVYLDMVERELPSEELFSPFKLAAYLSRNLRSGIEQAVPAVAEVMRYLRELAGKMPVNQAIHHISPAGFPMVQHYAQEESVRVYLDGLGMQFNMTRFNDSLLNRAKCVNGISPNFTHGLDSSHLVFTVDEFVDDVMDLIPVHDSFATHACDVDEMHRVLRSTFVQMYQQHDPIEALTQSVEAVCGEEIQRPIKGTLDVTKVLDSEFFMC